MHRKQNTHQLLTRMVQRTQSVHTYFTHILEGIVTIKIMQAN